MHAEWGLVNIDKTFLYPSNDLSLYQEMNVQYLSVFTQVLSR